MDLENIEFRTMTVVVTTNLESNFDIKKFIKLKYYELLCRLKESSIVQEILSLRKLAHYL